MIVIVLMCHSVTHMDCGSYMLCDLMSGLKIVGWVAPRRYYKPCGTEGWLNQSGFWCGSMSLSVIYAMCRVGQ